MTFSIGYLTLVFPDYGAKLRSAVFALGAVLGDSIENVADGDIPGIAATLEQTVVVERFLYLVAVSLNYIGKLPLRFVVVAENTLYVFTDVRREYAVGTLVKPAPVLMVRNGITVRLYSLLENMHMIVAGIMMGVNKIRLTGIAHPLHKLTREVGEFFRRHGASFHRGRHMELKTCRLCIAISLRVFFQIPLDFCRGIKAETVQRLDIVAQRLADVLHRHKGCHTISNLFLVISSAGETAAGHIVELLDYHFPDIIML